MMIVIDHPNISRTINFLLMDLIELPHVMVSKQP